MLMSNEFTNTEISAEKLLREKKYTVGDIVKILEVSHQAVYDWIRGGKLRAYRLGGNGGKNRANRLHWRIYESDLLIFVNRGVSVKTKGKAIGESGAATVDSGAEINKEPVKR